MFDLKAQISVDRASDPTIAMLNGGENGDINIIPAPLLETSFFSDVKRNKRLCISNKYPLKDNHRGIALLLFVAATYVRS
jgi:hypothetical protein